MATKAIATNVHAEHTYHVPNVLRFSWWRMKAYEISFKIYFGA